MLFAEQDWTPAWMRQAEDRAHRIGQDDTVLVQSLVVDGSIDGGIAKKLVAKQEIADKALDADKEPPQGVEESAARALTTELLSDGNLNGEGA